MVDWRGCRGCGPRWPSVRLQVLARSARVGRRTAKMTDRGWLIVVVRCGATMASKLRAYGGGWNGQICSGQLNVLAITSGLGRDRNEGGVLCALLPEVNYVEEDSEYFRAERFFCSPFHILILKGVHLS